MRYLAATIAGLGILLFIIGILPIGGSSEAIYIHSVQPTTNGTLEYDVEYDSTDILPYEKLSKRGQAVFKRALANSPYQVKNESVIAPDLDYTSDNVAPRARSLPNPIFGHGLFSSDRTGHSALRAGLVYFTPVLCLAGDWF